MLRPITADELILMVHGAYCELLEDGQTPHEVIFDKQFEALLRAGAVIMDIPFEKMTLFGMKMRFENLPDNVEFIVG